MRTGPLLGVLPLIVLVLANPARAASATTVKDPAHGFSFVVPDGFVDFPKDRLGAKILHAFSRGTRGTSSFEVLSIAAESGPVGRELRNHDIAEHAAREALNPSGLEVGSFTYRDIPWRSFQLELMGTRAEYQGNHVVILMVEVPMARQSITVSILGDAVYEGVLAAELRSFVDSIEGPSSWDGEAGRGSALDRIGVLVVGLVAAGLVVRWWWRRRRRDAA